MKQKDVALILVVSFISAMLSFFVSHALFTSPEKRQEKVELIGKITADFPAPDNRYFNKDAVNPTVLISTEPGANQQPFKNQ